MKKAPISTSLELYLLLTRIFTQDTRQFNAGLDGIGLSEFIALLYLSQTPSHTMRRTDLAEKLGLTASGVTRLLLPMEKTGLVARKANPHDARVSYVVITESGKRNVQEKLQDAEEMARAVFPPKFKREVRALCNHLSTSTS